MSAREVYTSPLRQRANLYAYLSSSNTDKGQNNKWISSIPNAFPIWEQVYEELQAKAQELAVQKHQHNATEKQQSQRSRAKQSKASRAKEVKDDLVAIHHGINSSVPIDSPYNVNSFAVDAVPQSHLIISIDNVVLAFMLHRSQRGPDHDSAALKHFSLV
ncbi:unnamed protein product [Aspergillus oryzae]|nr:unnamed protein product [Aspergillus oryzae]